MLKYIKFVRLRDDYVYNDFVILLKHHMMILHSANNFRYAWRIIMHRR